MFRMAPSMFTYLHGLILLMKLFINTRFTIHIQMLTPKSKQNKKAAHLISSIIIYIQAPPKIPRQPFVPRRTSAHRRHELVYWIWSRLVKGTHTILHNVYPLNSVHLCIITPSRDTNHDDLSVMCTFYVHIHYLHIHYSITPHCLRGWNYSSRYWLH